MNIEEKEIYSKLWIIVVKKLNNIIKYDAWKYAVDIYNGIKELNPNMKCLLIQMTTDLLSASVYNCYTNGEYEKICMKLINDRKKYLEELNQNIDLDNNRVIKSY